MAAPRIVNRLACGVRAPAGAWPRGNMVNQTFTFQRRILGN